MSCLIRSGFNVECMTQGRWMPFLKTSLDRSHSSIKRESKRKTKQVNTTEAVSQVKIKEKDEPEKAEVKHCETCNAMKVEGESTKETGNKIEKGTQTLDETVRKTSYPRISNFLIRNIMSFPIHGCPADTKEDHQTEDSKFSSFPSVSTILNDTMSSDAKMKLEKWKQNMISQMGSEKFLEVQKGINAYKLLTTLSRGSRLHGAIKRYLLGNDLNSIEVDENVEGCWKSVKTAFPHISNVKLIETSVYHPHLHYKGIVDCVACFKNVPHVIEWKQSEKVKKSLNDTYDAPIQLCAYMGTMPWCKSVNFTEPIANGLVVVAYVDGSPADIFTMNSEHCQRYWEQWLRRVQQFWLIHSPELKDNLLE